VVGVILKEGVDDGDEAASFDVGASPCRSSSTLDDMSCLGVHFALVQNSQTRTSNTPGSGFKGSVSSTS
jgi:hypothetical protein